MYRVADPNGSELPQSPTPGCFSLACLAEYRAAYLSVSAEEAAEKQGESEGLKGAALQAYMLRRGFTGFGMARWEAAEHLIEAAAESAAPIPLETAIFALELATDPVIDTMNVNDHRHIATIVLRCLRGLQERNGVGVRKTQRARARR